MELQLPKVAIIITNYNKEKYISESVDSVLGQSYKGPIKIIIIDDHSTDKSLSVINKIIAKHGDNVTLIKNRENYGQLRSEAIGFYSIKDADFINFLDGDDILLPNFIEYSIYAHLNSRKHLAFTTTDQIHFNESNTALTFHHNGFHPKNLELAYLDNFSEILFNDIAFNSLYIEHPANANTLNLPWRWGTGSTFMFRASALQLIMPDPFDDSNAQGFHAFRICGDFYLGHACRALFFNGIIDLPLIAFRRSTSNNFSDNPVISDNTFLGGMAKHPSVLSFNKLFLQTLKNKPHQNIFNHNVLMRYRTILVLMQIKNPLNKIVNFFKKIMVIFKI